MPATYCLLSHAVIHSFEIEIQKNEVLKPKEAQSVRMQIPKVLEAVRDSCNWLSSTNGP